MGWFGSSDSNSNNPSDDIGSYSDSSSSSYSSSSPYSSSSSPSSIMSGSGSNGLEEFREFSVQLQQQVLVQTVITDLTHKAFEKCCTTATSSNTLTGKEAACISAVTNKWLDSNEYLVERIQRKQQQQAGGSQF